MHFLNVLLQDKFGITSQMGPNGQGLLLIVSKISCNFDSLYQRRSCSVFYLYAAHFVCPNQSEEYLRTTQGPPTNLFVFFFKNGNGTFTNWLADTDIDFYTIYQLSIGNFSCYQYWNHSVNVNRLSYQLLINN